MGKLILLFSSIMVLLMLFACGGGGSGAPPPTPPYSQADLAGTWYAHNLQTGTAVSTGAEPGWMRGTVTIASSGTLSVPEVYTSTSPTTPVPGPNDLVWTIDPGTGLISETSGTYTTDFHAKLASGKDLIVGTATGNNGVMQLRILQKIDTNATYTVSDIADKTFALHQLESGVSLEWMHATGYTDPVTSEQTTTLTLSLFTKPSITGGPLSPGTLSIDASGIVTASSNSSFHGLVSADKTYMIATETDSTFGDIYRITVAQFTDPAANFVLADVAGSWHMHGLVNGFPAWLYQSLTVDDLGLATITSQVTSFGTSTNLPTPAYVSVDPDGTATVAGDPTLHGTFSSGKDMLVTTQTLTDGGTFYMLGITVK
jgi:hypothetical protein